MSCDSWDRNQSYDVLIKPNDDDLFHPVRLYLNPYEKRKSLITHPYVSPLFGDLGHLPPILIQYGDAEVLHDEISLLVNKIVQTRTTFVQYEVYDGTPVFFFRNVCVRLANIYAFLHIYHIDMVHVF